MANELPKEVKVPPRLSITPPREIETSPPPMANQVRVITTADVVTIHAYFMSPTLMDAALSGQPETGIRVEGDIAYIEAVPAARFSLPLTVSVALAELLIKNLQTMGPAVSPYVAAFLENLKKPEETAK